MEGRGSKTENREPRIEDRRLSPEEGFLSIRHPRSSIFDPLFSVFLCVLCAFVVNLLTGCGKSPVSAGPKAETVQVAPDRTADEETASPADQELVGPMDKEGSFLLAALRPAKPTEPLPGEAGKLKKKPAASPKIDEPRLPLPGITPELPRPPIIEKRTPVRPRILSEESQLSHLQLVLAPPEALRLPTGPRVRIASPDVNQPIPLPTLAHPASNRLSLDDPTVEFSHSAAVARIIPDRTNHAPFLRLVLPDPFEHRDAVRLGKLPPEDEIPFMALPGPSKP
jgi:hypothetical protein